MTKDELIAALAKATGPSQELDAEIALAINPGGRVRPNSRALETADGYTHLVQYYTASIDAALALAPEGYAVQGGRYHDGRGWWHIYEQPEGATRAWAGNGATPALALCIAALKARP